jgi:hypothetical protein
MKMKTTRLVAILQDSGRWLDREIQDVRKSQIFIMYEPNGQMVVDKTGNSIFMAITDPYKDSDGFDTISYKYLVH